MIYFDVNYLSIFVAAVVAMAIGAVWYNKKVFGAQWLMLVGLNPNTPEEKSAMNKKAMNAMMVGFVTSLVMAFMLANVLMWLNISQLNQALEIGFYLWLGFVATVNLMNMMYQQKNLKLFFIDSGYQLLAILAMSVIIASW